VARRFLTSIGLHVSATDPESGSDGDMYFNSSTNEIKLYYSGVWNSISAGGSSGLLDYLDFNTSSTATLIPGRVIWDSGEGSPVIGITDEVQLNLGQENIALCYNGTGSELTSGQAVYISSAQGQRPSISLASSSSEGTSSKTFGMVTETIANGGEGFVCTFGIVNGIDTSLFTPGQSLWLSSTPGTVQNSIPDSPQHAVFVGYCLSSNASSGRIFINPQNGYEIGELHDVLISSVQDGQTLTYESATGLWKNTTIDALPSQTGNDGKYLTTDGTNASWADSPGGFARGFLLGGL